MIAACACVVCLAAGLLRASLLLVRVARTDSTARDMVLCVCVLSWRPEQTM